MRIGKKKITSVIFLLLIVPSLLIFSNVNNVDSHSTNGHESMINNALIVLENTQSDTRFIGMTELVNELNIFKQNIIDGNEGADSFPYGPIGHSWDPINRRGIRIDLDTGEQINPFCYLNMFGYDIPDGAMPCAMQEFDLAKSHYLNDEKNDAYYHLGWALHCIQDVIIPYHTASNQFMSGIDIFMEVDTRSEVDDIIDNANSLTLTGIHTDFEDHCSSYLTGLDFSDVSLEPDELENILKIEEKIIPIYGYNGNIVATIHKYYHEGSFVQSAALFGRDLYDIVNNHKSIPNWDYAANKISKYGVKLTAIFLYYFWNCISNFDYDSDGKSGYDEYSYTVGAMNKWTNIFNPFITDSDYDGVIDGQETNPSYAWSYYDTDQDGVTDFIENQLGLINDEDSDNDRLKDGEEVYGIPKANHPYSNDFGMIQGLDPKDEDTDNDDLRDDFEVLGIYIPADPGKDNDRTVYTNPLAADSDGDGINDDVEISFKWDPNKIDSDQDGLSDDYELANGLNPGNSDTDGDGLPDGWEVTYTLNPLINDALEDLDNDGWYVGTIYYPFNNLQEYLEGTNPLNVDTDSDGLDDGSEVNIYFTDPNNDDTDNDELLDGEEINGIYVNSDIGTVYPNPKKQSSDYPDIMSDGWEIRNGYDPTKADTDGDTVWDKEENDDSDELTNEQEYLCYAYGLLYAKSSSIPTLPILMYCNPRADDTDNDELLDHIEINSVYYIILNDEICIIVEKISYPNAIDSDEDLWNDLDEYMDPYDWSDLLNPDYDQDGILDGWEHNYLNSGNYGSNDDNDGDGLINLYEFYFNTDPLNTDTDSDGMDDKWEWTYFIDESEGNPDLDPDNDGVTNLVEYNNSAHPHSSDTDKDGLDDYQEIYIYHTNPAYGDTDGEGILDDEEVQEGSDGYITNPNNPDTDGDGYTDKEEIDGPSGLGPTNPLHTYEPNTRPSGVALNQVQNQDTQLVLTWNELKGSMSYEIYISNGGAYSLYAITEGNVYTITLQGLTANTLYSIKIRGRSAYNPDVYSEYSYASCRTVQPKPATPTLTVSNYNSITVTFVKSPSASSVKIYLRIAGGTWEDKGEYGTSPQTITKLKYNTNYEVRIVQKASADLAWSPFSNIASITTGLPTPSAPTNFLGIPSSSSIALTWKKPSNIDPASQLTYKIYMKIGGTYQEIHAQTHAGSSTATQSFTVYDLTEGVTYYFRITATLFTKVSAYAYWSGLCGEVNLPNQQTPISINLENNGTNQPMSFMIALLNIVCIACILRMKKNCFRKKRM